MGIDEFRQLDRIPPNSQSEWSWGGELTWCFENTFLEGGLTLGGRAVDLFAIGIVIDFLGA